MSTTTAVTGSGQESLADDFAAARLHGRAGRAARKGADLANIPVLNLDTLNPLDAGDGCPVEKTRTPRRPAADGRWLVRIKQRDVKGADGQPARYKVARDKEGEPYAFTALDATVSDPSGKYDGVQLADYFVSTRADSRKGGAIPLAWILTQLKVQLPARVTARLCWMSSSRQRQRSLSWRSTPFGKAVQTRTPRSGSTRQASGCHACSASTGSPRTARGGYPRHGRGHQARQGSSTRAAEDQRVLRGRVGQGERRGVRAEGAEQGRSW